MVPVAVDRLETAVVVRAAVEEFRNAPARARERDLIDLHRRERARDGGRCGDGLGDAEPRSCRRCQSDDVVADDIAFEPEPRPGDEVRRVEDPATLGVERLEFRLVEQPVVERPRQHVGPVLAERPPRHTLRISFVLSEDATHVLHEWFDHELVDRGGRELPRPQLRPSSGEHPVRHRSSRHRRRVPQIVEHPRVGEVAHHAERGERGAESAAGERRADRCPSWRAAATRAATSRCTARSLRTAIRRRRARNRSVRRDDGIAARVAVAAAAERTDALHDHAFGLRLHV